MNIPCPECSVIKEGLNSLETHLVIEHLGYVRWQCYDCGTCRHSKEQLEEHMQSAHGTHNGHMIYKNDKQKDVQLRQLLELAIQNLLYDSLSSSAAAASLPLVLSTSSAQRSHRSPPLAPTSSSPTPFSLDNPKTEVVTLDENSAEQQSNFIPPESPDTQLPVSASTFSPVVDFSSILLPLLSPSPASTSKVSSSSIIKQEPDFADSDTRSSIHMDITSSMLTPSTSAPDKYGLFKYFSSVSTSSPSNSLATKFPTLAKTSVSPQSNATAVPSSINNKKGKVTYKLLCKRCNKAVSLTNYQKTFHALFHLFQEEQIAPFYCTAPGCDYKHYSKSAVGTHLEIGHEAPKGTYSIGGKISRGTEIKAMIMAKKCFDGVKKISSADIQKKKEEAGEERKKQRAKAHAQTSERVFCQLCAKSIAVGHQNRDLLDHFSKHVLDAAKRYRFHCQMCDHKASGRKCILRHMKTHDEEEDKLEFTDELPEWDLSIVYPMSKFCFKDKHFIIGRLPQNWHDTQNYKPNNEGRKRKLGNDDINVDEPSTSRPNWEEEEEDSEEGEEMENELEDIKISKMSYSQEVNLSRGESDDE